MHSLTLISVILLGSLVAPAQTLTGVVVDTNGAAVETASVVLFEGNSQKAKTQTDADGRFTVTGTITDRSRLAVNAEGFSPFNALLQTTAYGISLSFLSLPPFRVM